MTGPVDLAREAFARRAWGEAHALLRAGGPSDAGDLERLAVAAHLLGRDEDSAPAWERASAAFARAGDHDGAARCAFWLAFSLLLRGETGRAGGWLARAEREVEDAGGQCAARGYLLVPAVLEALEGGNAGTAEGLAAEMVDVAERFGEGDLLALGMLAQGQAALALGETKRALRRLDEVMVSVTGGEVSPIPAGIVYCAVIEACMDAFDLRRAAEWTDALDGWCAAQPDLVPYRGQCLVHRSQVLQAQGDWVDAMSEAERARVRLSEPEHPALGLALYQQGELHRLRGDLAAAERAYRAASEYGREPAPGFALLRLAEGNAEAAVAAVNRMLAESRGRLTRPAILAAAVEVLLAAADVGAAGAAAAELAETAAAHDRPLLLAVSAYATGSVLLAGGDAPAALTAFRRACAAWRDLGVPYDAARARVQIGRACRALGDHDAADLELEAARTTFERLGAAADLAGVVGLAGPKVGSQSGPLTDRECEVLRLVATGQANREIAATLVISEHTVARHLQNIFLKLGLSSRAAATAYAYQHGLA